MSIHAVDKKSGFFCVESGPKLIYFLVICVNRMGSKNRGILLIEMWKLRKRLSVAKLVTKCDQAPQTSIEHTSTCVLPEIQPSSPREEALTASSVTTLPLVIWQRTGSPHALVEMPSSPVTTKKPPAIVKN